MAMDTPHSYAKLLQSEKFSDLVIKCEDREFKVHKAIVCSQSEVLLAACDGQFKEAVSGIISIDEFDAETVKRMIDYMYTGDYYSMEEWECDDTPNDEHPSLDVETEAELTEDPPRETLGSERSPVDNEPGNEPEVTRKSPTMAEMLLPHLKLNAIADYYAIPRLCHLANVEVQIILDRSWSPNGFSSVVTMASMTGDKTLPNVLAVAAAENIESLVDAGESIPCPDIANSVIQKLTAAKKQMKDEYDGRIQGLQARLALLTIESENRAQARANAIDFSKLLNRTDGCRNVNCSETFPVLMEAMGSEEVPSYILRCATCKCRHEVGREWR